MSLHDGPHYHQAARAANADAFLSKEALADHLLETIRTLFASAN